ncbi:MAG: DUF924 domain-containing protein, partial [Alphaproteobacteria bacterium]|nr:DUF924 domain-containing protein [Alphaproteobacteria bacterium]
MNDFSASEAIEHLGDMPEEAMEILHFWFIETAPEQYFTKDSTFDATIRARFLDCMQQLTDGAYQTWVETSGGALASCIAIDQFSRNVHRDTPEAFRHDAITLKIARHIRDQKLYQNIPQKWRSFCFLPFMHSEDLADQDECIRLGQELVGDDNFVKFAQMHRVIIARFGRFPQRNQTLGRPSTAEEIAF